MVPLRPNPRSTVATWRYHSLIKPLMKSGELITAEEAERRVLMLANPNLSSPNTTDTIYAGLHFTAVEGEKLMMERGDVILTPTWCWHDYGSEGAGPMVWLDGLDLPVYRFLLINFVENFAESRYPSSLATSSKLKISWATVAAKLDAEIFVSNYAKYEYRFDDGAHLSRTISAQAERVASGSTTPASRETCSFVYTVYEGSGYSDIVSPDGKKERVEWTKKNSFSVPAWSIISHTCDMSDEQAYLFTINDKPIVEALGLWKKD